MTTTITAAAISEKARQSIEKAGGSVRGLKVVFPDGTLYRSNPYEAKQVSSYMEKEYPTQAAQYPPVPATTHVWMLPQEGDIILYTKLSGPSMRESGGMDVQEKVAFRRKIAEAGYKTWKDFFQF